MRSGTTKPPDKDEPSENSGPVDTKSSAPENIKGLASLKFEGFRLLFWSTPFGNIGNSMRTIVNAWQIYEITGSSAQLGLAFLFQGIPGIFFSVFGGTLADMFDRRKIINISQGYQILSGVALGFLTLSGHIHVWHIYVMTFLSSSIGSAAGPARRALITNLVPRSHLLNATTLQTSVQQATQIAGPTLAGFILAAFGPAPAYFINALCIIPGYYAIMMLKDILVQKDTGKKEKVRLNLGSIFGGLVFAWQTQVLLFILLMDTVTNVLGYYQYMMPVIAKDILNAGPIGLGILLSATPFGSFFGYALILALGNLKRKGLVMVITVIVYNVFLFAFAQSKVFWLSLLILGAMGAVDAFSRAIRNTLLQLMAPDEKRGRVVALSQIFAGGGNSMGGAYLGFMSEAIGIQKALAIGAVISAGFAVSVGAFVKRVRKFDL